MFQKLLCDARIGDQRGDKAGAKYDADSLCFVHAAGHGDNFGDAAKLFSGDADHALAECALRLVDRPQGYDLVVEATGVPAAIEAAFGAVAKGGRSPAPKIEPLLP